MRLSVAIFTALIAASCESGEPAFVEPTSTTRLAPSPPLQAIVVGQTVTGHVGTYEEEATCDQESPYLCRRFSLMPPTDGQLVATVTWEQTGSWDLEFHMNHGGGAFTRVEGESPRVGTLPVSRGVQCYILLSFYGSADFTLTTELQ
jgi:hypothetical protein